MQVNIPYGDGSQYPNQNTNLQSTNQQRSNESTASDSAVPLLSDVENLGDVGITTLRAVPSASSSIRSTVAGNNNRVANASPVELENPNEAESVSVEDIIQKIDTQRITQEIIESMQQMVAGFSDAAEAFGLEVDEVAERLGVSIEAIHQQLEGLEVPIEAYTENIDSLSQADRRSVFELLNGSAGQALFDKSGAFRNAAFRDFGNCFVKFMTINDRAFESLDSMLFSFQIHPYEIDFEYINNEIVTFFHPNQPMQNSQKTLHNIYSPLARVIFLNPSA